MFSQKTSRIIGGSGTIGQEVTNALKGQADVIVAGRNSEFKVDLSDNASIKALFEKVGKVDHVVNVAGSAYFGPLVGATPEKFLANNKLNGQVSLVLLGLDYVNDNGSFTLTTGILSDLAIPLGSALSMVNGGVNAFVRTASTELPRGIRINAVSPGLITESLPVYGPYFKGFTTLPASVAANGYVRSVYGGITGKVIEINPAGPNA
eukprot:NODE_7312_length_791_cov_35.706587_g6703_i0.p1 GENE.NODE_7312_length_791_cov_35.706587_g6703_i0~~NODE_7312_length_791_cov_35.706587_g6703_i0.p1  ORF type:complete len:207 (+),score=27.65 NODE_7312_length_791_cov_35.706587_g6703_i0:53-673(+)